LSERHGSEGRGLKTGLWLILLMIFGGSTGIWAQQGLLPIGPQAAASLPDSPQPQAPVETIELTGQAAPEEHSTGSIRGVVVDRDGSVCEGATVSLTQADMSAQEPRTTTSDSNGKFSFADVRAGSFKLTISTKGFASQVVTGALRAGEDFDAQSIVLAVTSTSEVNVTASQVEIATEQVKEEEQQRVLGVIPNFYVSYSPNPAPLTSRQKFSLAWKTSIDPVTFVVTGIFAGVEQEENTFSGYGQGAEGYAKRYGAGYADSFISTMLGSAILPSWWKQDPRYFYKGTGSTRSRILYAIANSVICKGDNGKWQANYSGIVGGLAAGGISNIYYPASDRDGAKLTFEDAAIGTAESAVQNLIQEFIVKKLTPKIPNYGSGKP
jgi:hypothetical protein